MRNRTMRELGLGLGVVGLLATLAATACTSNTTNNNGSSGGGGSQDASTTPDGDTSSPDGGAADGSSGPAKPFHAVTGTQDDERFTGVGGSTPPRIYAIDGSAVNATPLFTSDDAFANSVGVVGTVGFLGFSKVGTTLIARTDPGGQAFVSATDDPRKAESWKVAKVGKVIGGEFALNAEYGFGQAGSDWIQVRNSFVYSAPATPAPDTAWTTVWSPGNVSNVPADLDAQHAADATICISEVAYSSSPRPTQAAYVAGDGAIVLYPGHALNQQKQDDVAGVCISTDGGKKFHLAKLAVAEDINGPSALTCTSKDHCVVAGGMVFTANSSYVFVSNNASAGATSTWTKATIPPTTENTIPNQIFFAPDGQHGWLVGSKDNGPMLWSTTDGGATWKDETSSIAAFTERALWSGYAFDATHVVIGGQNGGLISNF